VHPIERLRYVARTSGGDQRLLVRETASAIAALRADPAGLVVSCRRIVERHPTSGPMWWLCANLVTAVDPARAVWELVEQLDDDATADHLVAALAEDAQVSVIDWPDFVGEALVRRGDVAPWIVDVSGEGAALARRLSRAGDVDVDEVGVALTATAVEHCDVVLVEALAVGDTGALCALGSHAMAAVGYCAEKPVWLVAGRGRRLPDQLWAAMLTRAEPPDHRGVEVVPLAMISHVVDHRGVHEIAAADLTPECPPAPELLRTSPI
jgi:hypothetical protein